MFPKIKNSNNIADDDTLDPKYKDLKLPQLLSMGVNDWFDPVFIYRRID